MIDWSGLVPKLRADDEFVRLARDAHVAFGLRMRGSDDGAILRVAAGDVADDVGEPDFTVVLDRDSWLDVGSAAPTPGRQSVFAHLAPRGTGAILGDPLAFAQHAHLVRRAAEVLAARPAVAPSDAPSMADLTGRYVRIDVAPWGQCDVFVERAGSGRPVLLLHTAGADSRQFHGLLARAAALPGRELIAFDLPWHGRSNPAHGRGNLDWTLSSESYTACIVAVIEALNLDEPPVIVGSSMAGAAVVEVAARHPQAISGAVGCQVGPRVGNRHNQWLRNPRVNQALFLPEWTFGLMNPASPAPDRNRVWWGYSQGGYGVYERDIVYYTRYWDIDNVAHLFGPHSPPVVLMSGAYDYSVPTAATRELAARVPGAALREMPELGHFPHAENPTVFAGHLAWALAEIDRTRPI